MTAEELAERALTTVNYIRQIESGEYGVSLSKLIVICNALEINPGVLVSNFIVCDLNDDSFYEELQDSKNLSENIIRYMKNKKVIQNNKFNAIFIFYNIKDILQNLIIKGFENIIL